MHVEVAAREVGRRVRLDARAEKAATLRAGPPVTTGAKPHLARWRLSEQHCAPWRLPRLTYRGSRDTSSR